MKKVEKWQKDLAVYRDINTTFIVEGNVHDRQPLIDEKDESCEPVPLSSYLYKYLSEEEYGIIIFYNRVDGFYNPYNRNMQKEFYREASLDEKSSISIPAAAEKIRTAIANSECPTAVIIDLANTMISSPNNLVDEEIECFTRLMLASQTPVQAISACSEQPLNNLLFLIVEKVNEIPMWFYLNNPYVRTLTVSRPDKEVRTAVVKSKLNMLKGANELSSVQRKKALEEFVALTDGMTLVEIFGVFSLCQQKEYNVLQIRHAIKMFRYGETESHWDKLDSEKIKNAHKYLTRRVKGQEQAINKAVSVLNRAHLGLSGIQGGSDSRPKGVLFFAGPTGTGKTELAKTIAEFVFGDESFMTRFDMSEYQQPHSDQKLLGAPPGYVGYSEGGQLTNAVKSKPFCVLLFDEIDKAHPSILDKFLQILEDGRITDSAGETVYFSEALIIFTSNLGVVGKDSETGKRFQTINPEMSYENIRSKLLETIKEYFKYTIQRPELLNRIGDNFVVFDFIREEYIKEILDLKLNTTIENLDSEKGIKLIIEEPFRQFLFNCAKQDLSNGGRGISNMVESRLINPLSDMLVKESCDAGSVVTISDMESDEKDHFKYTIGKHKK